MSAIDRPSDRASSSRRPNRERPEPPAVPQDFSDRVPPQNLEAEAAVLGAIMLDPETAWVVAQFLKPEHFYKAANREIFEIAIAYVQDRKPVDILTLKEELSQRGKLEAVGGDEYLKELVDAVPTAANAEHYAKLVHDKFQLRSLISVATSIARDAYEVGGPVAGAMDRAEKKFFEVTSKRVTDTAVDIRTLLHEEFDRIDQGASMKGVMTNLHDLDQVTNGFRPAELIILAARPSMGKCLAHDAEVVLEDGRVATMEEIHREQNARLLTLRDDWRLEVTAPSAYVDDGMKPVFRVTTRLGRTIETTLTHPFRTLEGWRPLAELSVGARIAAPRRIPIFGRKAMRECEVKLLAYLIGDGGLTGPSAHFTNSNPAIQADFLGAVEEFGGVRASRTALDDARAPSWRIAKDPAEVTMARGAFSNRLRSLVPEERGSMAALARSSGVHRGALRQWVDGEATPGEDAFMRLCEALDVAPGSLAPEGLRGARKNAASAMGLWLEAYGLAGKGAAQKCIPAAVFTLPREQLALFLNRLFSTDGWATVLAAGQPQLGYASVSERLAKQVQHLLLRFGVIASLKRRSVKYKEERRPAFQLDITDARSIATFAQEIGIVGKEPAVAACLAATRRRRYQTNRDLIPLEIWSEIARKRGGESWASLARRAGFAGATNIHAGKRAPTRDRLAALANALEDRKLAALASSDVYWDEIVSIEPLGPKQVYDLTIPGTHNFVANDICVHNTSLATTFIRNVACQHKVPVAFYSLEMSKNQVTQNMLCGQARVDSFKLRQGRLDQRELDRLRDGAAELAEAPIFIDDASSVSIMELRAKARMLKMRHKIGMVVIDYLQLMEGEKGAAKEDNRTQEISQISRGLKQLSRELELPVIALAQLNRGVEQREGHKPRLSDLRESGSIEQDADMVLMLYREAYYKPEVTDPQVTNKATVVINKNRNGPVGEVNLFFHREYTRFDNWGSGEG